MKLLLHPWHLFAMALASALTAEQSRVVAYLKAENVVLREQLNAKGGRIRYTDEQRKFLASAAKSLSRRLLKTLDTLVTPDTLLRWHRELVAKKYDGSQNRRAGRPRIRAELELLIARIAGENPRWGYERIRGELLKLGHVVARTTIANVLARHGIAPAPTRRTTWKDFLKAHWDVLSATDFFTVEVWTPVGLVRHYVRFVIELKSRRVHIGGIIDQPYGAWVEQVARALTDAVSPRLRPGTQFLCDRDPLFARRFQQLLQQSGVTLVRIPPRSPNLNAYAERFVLSIKAECLSRLILFSERQLRYVVGEYIAHYHAERPHQGRENRALVGRDAANEDGEVTISQRLGGLLRSYSRVA